MLVVPPIAKASPTFPFVIEYLITPFAPKSKSVAVTVVTCGYRMSQMLYFYSELTEAPTTLDSLTLTARGRSLNIGSWSHASCTKIVILMQAFGQTIGGPVSMAYDNIAGVQFSCLHKV